MKLFQSYYWNQNIRFNSKSYSKTKLKLEFHSNIKKINSVPNEISFTETIKNTIKLVYIFLVLSERNDLISLEILFYVRFDFTSRIETINYLKKSNEQITIKDFEYQKFMISIYSYNLHLYGINVSPRKVFWRCRIPFTVSYSNWR